MSSVNTSVQCSTVSTMKLILISAGSAVFTILAMLLLVLPVNYGLDPSGLGAKLGITKILASLSSKRANIDAIKLANPQMQGTVPVEAKKSVVMDEQSQGLPVQSNQSFELVVLPKQSLNFNFAMERDYELDYHWVTDGKPLYTELHGLKKDAKTKELKVFGKLKESRGKGFFIAPFNGAFSLTWKNESNQTAKIRLNFKGNYQLLS